ncbi:MAG TPA: hypothetical protein DCQ51_09400 [Planktothrix sp. UBA8407]|jgi:hypothetical protein|nr:hypothetical protein [Planktothrix sp. UBA8407]
MNIKVKPQTVNWKPPKLPPNWRTIDETSSAGCYRSRNGLAVMISCCRYEDGKNWIHLSISRRKSYPTWDEQVHIKELFLGKESKAIQVFPPRSQWVNDHPYCLHLWECLDGFELPDFRILGTI